MNTIKSDRYRTTGTRETMMRLVECTDEKCAKTPDLSIGNKHFHKRRVPVE